MDNMDDFFTEKGKKLIIFSVSILVVFLVLFHFTDTPMPWVDEGVYTETARNIAMHGVMGMQIEPGKYFSMRNFLLSSSYPVILPVSASIQLFGIGIWQSRLPMVLYMFLFLVASYLFVKKKYGFYHALVAVGLILSFSPFYGNGRPVQGEVAGLTFIVLGAWLSLFWEKSGFTSRKWAFLSGLFFGLASATKPIYFMIFSLAVVLSLLLWFKKFKDKKVLLSFAIGFLVPISIWIYIHIPTIDSFLKFVSVSIYLAGTHGSSVSTGQTIAINSLKFLTESTPILFMFLFVTTLIAFIARLFRKKESIFNLAEYIIFSFIVLNLLAYLPGTGWYRYFFPAHVLLYLLFPAAISAISFVFNKIVFKKTILLIPVILIIFQFVHLIFYSDTRFTAEFNRSRGLQEVLSGIKPEQTVFFHQASEAIIFLKHDNYSQYFNMGNFFVFGDKDQLEKPSTDFILVRGHYYDFPCYEKKEVNRYDFFKKIADCKK